MGGSCSVGRSSQIATTVDDAPAKQAPSPGPQLLVKVPSATPGVMEANVAAPSPVASIHRAPSPAGIEAVYHDVATHSQVSMSRFCAFIPDIVQNALVRHREADCPPPEPFEGALLFADASGFTALTQELQSAGFGADQMCHLLNQFFDMVIREAVDRGGDICKFSGDALTIVWPAAEGGLARATVSAAAASLAMHHAIQTRPHGTEKTVLKMHMGLGAGEMRTMHVGGVFGRWEFVLIGDPLTQISVAEPLAASNQTVVSPQAAALLQDSCELSPVAADPAYKILESCRADSDALQAQVDATVLLPVVAEDVDLVCRYIPGAVHKRLRSGADHLAEVRTITTLFVNIMGIDLQDADAANQAHSVMCALQRVVYQHDGSVNKMVVDDKGMLFIAAFGLPPLRSTEDAIHAVATAFDIVKTLKSMGYGGRVGVATGNVFCGVVGSELRQEYTVMGSCVNLSARLMAQCRENDIRVDLATREAAGQTFLFDVLGEVSLKGFETTVEIFKPTMKRRDRGRVKRRESQVFTSRDTDMLKMSTAMRSLTEAGGGVVVITGARGSGKKAMVEKAMQVASSLCLRIVAKSRDGETNKFSALLNNTSRDVSLQKMGKRGSIQHIFERPSFCAWRELIIRLLGQHQIHHNESMSEGDQLVMEEHLLSLIADQSLHPFLGLFSHWMPGAEKADLTPEVEAMSVEAKEGKMVELMLGLISMLITRSSMAIVFPISLPRGNHVEEVYDPLSWALLARVVDLIDQRVLQHKQGALKTPVLFIVSIRTTRVSLPEALQKMINVSKLHGGMLVLRPLGQRERVAHLRDCLKLAPDEALHSGLAEAVFARAGGNPEHIATVAEFLVEEGYFAPRVEGEPMRLLREDSLQDAPCPVKVLDAIHEELDTLDADSQQVLQAASVFSPVFSKETLLVAMGSSGGHWDAGRVASVLRQLIATEMVAKVPESELDELPAWFSSSADSQDAYTFCSEFVRQLIFKRLPDTQKQQLRTELAEHQGVVSALVQPRSLSTPSPAPSASASASAS